MIADVERYYRGRCPWCDEDNQSMSVIEFPIKECKCCGAEFKLKYLVNYAGYKNGIPTRKGIG